MNELNNYFTLLRDLYDKEGTPGELLSQRGVHLCATLEKPWLDNKPGISCIPEGIYVCKRDYSGKFQYWKVVGVENRQNIELHYGNCIDDIEGCILLGAKNKTYQKHPKTGKVYKYWLDNSKITTDRLIADKLLPDEFQLKVTSKTGYPKDLNNN